MRKYIILLILCILPMLINAQKLVKCNNSIAYFIKTKYDANFYIKLVGKSAESENVNVITYNDYAVQTLIAKKQDYQSNGKEETPILTNYIMGETKYFTQLYKAKLNLTMEPYVVSDVKKAILWYFDIPAKIQQQAMGGSPAIRQLSISIVMGDYIFSIGTTQFKDQSLESVKKVLTDLIKTANFSKGEIEKLNLCK